MKLTRDTGWLRTKEYNGMIVQYAARENKKPAVVFAKGLSAPGEHYAWMHLLHEAGISSVYAAYRGQFENYNAGSFIGKETTEHGMVSVVQDVDDLVSFAVDELGAKEVCLVGQCFGGGPALVVGGRRPEVKKIFVYAPMIFTKDEEKNKLYAENGDLALVLGEVCARDCGSFYKKMPNGFSLESWKQMVSGYTELNPYNCIDFLLEREIMIMHPFNDGTVSHLRSQDFYDALVERADAKGIEANALLYFLNGNHKTGFGFEQKKIALRFIDSSLTDKEINSAFQNTESSKKEIAGLLFDAIKYYKANGFLNDLPNEQIASRILGSDYGLD